jgi:hypothetical protein
VPPVGKMLDARPAVDVRAVVRSGEVVGIVVLGITKLERSVRWGVAGGVSGVVGVVVLGTMRSPSCSSLNNL